MSDEGLTLFWWDISDVKELDNTLTDKEAKQVLSRLGRLRRGAVRATWLEFHINLDMWREEQ